MYKLKEIAQITQSDLLGSGERNVKQFLYDSRHLQAAGETLFIALQSDRNDGHDFVADLYQKGVRAFMVTQGRLQPDDYPEAGFIICANPLLSLQALAAHHRTQFQIPVIGITGSNGKTIVKEWLYQCLKSDFSICRSPRSYNSQIGVALSILNLEAHHTLAIFEAGISQPGEMERLEKMICPQIGVFTHLGPAHDEGFTSRIEKLNEKFKLFAHAETLVLNGTDLPSLPMHAGVNIIEASSCADLTSDMKLRDEASLANGASCAAVLRFMGYSDAVIRARLAELQSVAMRLEMRSGIFNSLLINDYYNSDLDSLRIALNYMRQNSRRPKNCLILSDIEQSGLSASELYRRVSELVKQNKIDLLVGIGTEISRQRSFFPPQSLFFPDVLSFSAAFRSTSYLFSQSTILLKGSRSAGFELISRLLQLKSHDTVFEINLDRLRDNVNHFRALVSPATGIMCMVKATAYGSGSAEIARALQSLGVRYLAVAYADEGVELRESLITLPVMVMNPEEEAFDDLINFQLEPEVYSFNLLEKFAAKVDALALREPVAVHIKIDTGMKRLGFEPHEITDLCAHLKSLPQLRVASIFSHLVASDNNGLDDFTKQQIHLFESGAAQLTAALGYEPILHLCNSAAISRFPQAHYQMVRLGIGMYGIGSDEAEQKKLRNVGTLRSRISQIKAVKKGETIGYNRKGVADTDKRIAVIPIGYADGFSRLLGNGRHGVYVQGQLARTVGNICMDMCMVDVTDINCREGDEVLVFSTTGQIQSLAEALGTIPYEVLTSVSARVRRIYTQE